MSDYTKEREALYAIWNNESEETYMSELEDYIAAIDANTPDIDSKPKSKYHRLLPKENVWIDVYDVLHTFNVDNPAIAHAVKKMLCAGTRGYKDYQQDIQEAIDSLERAKDFPPIPF